MPSNNDCFGEPGHRRRHRRHRARKERVLHTRVSDRLADDIRRIADDLRVPTSNLVRNVLEEVFDVVDAVSDDVGQLFDEVFEEADAARQRLARRQARRSRGGDSAAWSAAKAEVDAAERTGPAGPPPPPIEWHVVENGRPVGPRDQTWLTREARAGRLERETLVWCAGMSDWLPASSVAALASVFAPPPVPEPPAAPEPPEVPPSDAADAS